MKNHHHIYKPACPYCGSIQTKGMPRQPVKYPKPVDPVGIQDWHNGFDCKKCGSEFVINPNVNSVVAKSSSGGCLSSTIRIAVVVLVIIGVIAYFSLKYNDKNPSKINESDPIEQIIKDKEQEAVNRPAVESLADTKLDDTFNDKSEAAAHGDYNPTPVAIDQPEPKTQESEHLTITETIR